MSSTPALVSSQRDEVIAKATAARRVAATLAQVPTDVKNTVLRAAAERLRAESAAIIAANAEDVQRGEVSGMSAALIDRLRLDRGRIDGMAAGLEQVADLTDPVGEVLTGSRWSNGLRAQQVRVPLGVMGMVYEARPNVTVDAFGLAFKSGNVALLRGSKSAVSSNASLVALLQDVVVDHGLPREAVQLLPCETHDSVTDLITARGLVDVVIPRGGAKLIETVVTHATVPAIETGTGNCHVFVAADADIRMATDIVINGKTRRCSVCNATETLLLDRALPEPNQLGIVMALQDAGVTIHGDAADLAALGVRDVVAADEADWAEEYLSMDIAVARVDGVDGALTHIDRYSSGHTEAIVTASIDTATYFADRVDAAAVMINASTAFTDGEQYGMGAEIGISTQKLHARGPMALPELTTTKWIITGAGHTRP